VNEIWAPLIALTSALRFANIPAVSIPDHTLRFNRRSPEFALDWAWLALADSRPPENPDISFRRLADAKETARGLFVSRQMKLADLQILRGRVEKAARAKTDAEVEYELFLESLDASAAAAKRTVNPLKKLSEDKKREELLKKKAGPVKAAREVHAALEKQLAALEAEIAKLEAGREAALANSAALEERWIAAASAEALSMLASEGPDSAAAALEARLGRDPRRIEFNFLLWMCAQIASGLSADPEKLLHKSRAAIAEIRASDAHALAAAMEACDSPSAPESPPATPSDIGARAYPLYSLCRVMAGAPAPAELEPPRLAALAEIVNLAVAAEKRSAKTGQFGDIAGKSRDAAARILESGSDFPDSALALAGHVHILCGAASDWIDFLTSKSVALTPAHRFSLGILALAHKSAGREVPSALLDMFRRGRPDSFLWYTLSAVEGVPRLEHPFEFSGGLFLIP